MKGESMFSMRKVVGKAVAATATTGVLVAPLALATSPQLMNVACSDNVNETTVTLDLERGAAPYGTRTIGTAVLSRTPSTPDSFVEFRVSSGDRTFATYSKRAGADGTVSRLLPRGLAAGREYTVEARFETCAWSNPATYTVNKATATPAPSVVNARRAIFRTTVDGGGGLDPDAGGARFTVRKRGAATLIRDRVEFLDEGVAKVNFKNLTRGRYVLKVTYQGNRNFLEGSKSLRFRVR